MKKLIVTFIICTIIIQCKTTLNDGLVEIELDSHPYLLRDHLPINPTFGFPLNYPTMKGYYDANPFGNVTNLGKHLGCDLNKVGGGNNDYKDTIYSIGYGMVIESSGALIAILHKTKYSVPNYIIASYFHCDTIFVVRQEYITAGQPIGLVGKKYAIAAHLHFEILTDTTKTNVFYGDFKDCLDPIQFIYNY